MKTLYLVDASSLFFRSYYAISTHLTSPQGLPTNALYGFLSMTTKLLRENSVEHVMYCFDPKTPSFRHAIYPQYKANRGEMPEDLKKQVPYIKKLTKAMSIPSMEMETYEADDLIGAMAMLGLKQDYQVVIVSGDKDFAQLVKDRIKIYDPMKDINYDTQAVQKKWGIWPNQMVDYLAIVGDSSDNIPGARGIGPKGAQKLLNQYSNLEKIYTNLSNIPAKIAEKLLKSKENVFLSRQLASIITDIKFKTKPNFHRGNVNKKALTHLLQELGFAIKESYFAPVKQQVVADNLLQLNTVDKASMDSHAHRNNEFGGSDKLYGNDETGENGKNNKASKLKTKQIGNLKIHYLSLPELEEWILAYAKLWVFSHQNQYFISYKNKIISLENISLEKVGNLLLRKSVSWYAYHLKNIWKKFFPIESSFTYPWQISHFNKKNAIYKQRQAFLQAGNCLMMAAYIVNPEAPLSFSALCTHYLKLETQGLSPGEIYKLHKELWKLLEKLLSEQKKLEIYQNIELALIPILFEMESYGISLDKSKLNEQSQDITKYIKAIETKIFNYTKDSFNLASSKQLADVLFKEIGLKPVRKTKTGYSTDADVLQYLKNKHPMIPLLLKHRELFKLKTTYIETLPKLVKEKTQSIHTQFQQALTSTGRLSSMHPNLQNIPIRTERGLNVREAFIAKESCLFIAADYSQIELRILAHITKDPVLCEAFERDLDIHKQVAANIYAIPLEQVNVDQRRAAKAVNFGLIYGQGAYTLSTFLGISLEEAKDLIKNYFKKFKKVKEYMEWAASQALKQNYVETLFGRKRYIKELKSHNFRIRKFGERAAINMPIQGTASDLVKMAMIELRNSLYSQMLLQIHDELLFECPIELLEEEVPRIQHIMEHIVDWKVPLKVNISTGKNWKLASIKNVT